MNFERMLASTNLQRLEKLLTLKNLRIVCALLGLVPVYIGSTGIFSGLGGLVAGAEISSASDGQYRYLSAIYLGFGFQVIWIQFRLETEIQLFRILMSMVFVAGVARSFTVFGNELPSFLILLALAFEIIFPPILLIWHQRVVDPNTPLPGKES